MWLNLHKLNKTWLQLTKPHHHHHHHHYYHHHNHHSLLAALLMPIVFEIPWEKKTHYNHHCHHHHQHHHHQHCLFRALPKSKIKSKGILLIKSYIITIKKIQREFDQHLTILFSQLLVDQS